MLEKHQTVVIVGATGCGKSTQIPQVSRGLDRENTHTHTQAADSGHSRGNRLWEKYPDTTGE